MRAPSTLREWVVPVIAAALIAQTACSDSSEVLEGTAVRDSAGIRIVDNAAPMSSAWSVDPNPSTEIGGDEADSTQLLFAVAGAVGLTDGRIVVAHGPAPMVRWFDASGAYVTGTGRPGGGPGEFGGGESARISMLWPMAGDSVATWEHAPRRMQVFSPGGRFVRAVVLDLPPDMPVRAYPQLVGRLDGGFVAFLITPRQPGVMGEVVREPVTYIRYLDDGTYAGEIATLPGFTSYTYEYETPDGRQIPVNGRPPFAKLPSAWPGEDRLYYGSAEQYEIAVYDSMGSVEMLIRKPVPNQPVTAQLIDIYKTTTMAGAPDDPAQRRLWDQMINRAPYPEAFPAYRRLRVDRLGALWVQGYNLPGADSVTWSVFDRDGQWLSDVTIPEPWQVLDIGADYLLLLVRDELDIERVRRHSLVRS